jgi:uridine kinase
MKKTDKIPVVLITGYLGSGKTTLLNELLRKNAENCADRQRYGKHQR